MLRRLPKQPLRPPAPPCAPARERHQASTEPIIKHPASQALHSSSRAGQSEPYSLCETARSVPASASTHHRCIVSLNERPLCDDLSCCMSTPNQQQQRCSHVCAESTCVWRQQGPARQHQAAACPPASQLCSTQPYVCSVAQAVVWQLNMHAAAAQRCTAGSVQHQAQSQLQRSAASQPASWHASNKPLSHLWGAPRRRSARATRCVFGPAAVGHVPAMARPATGLQPSPLPAHEPAEAQGAHQASAAGCRPSSGCTTTCYAIPAQACLRHRQVPQKDD